MKENVDGIGWNGGEPALGSIAELRSFQVLATARRRLGAGTLLVVAISYGGFFGLVALEPQFLGVPMGGLGSTGFLLLLLMFLVAWIITWFYMHYTARYLVPLERNVLNDIHVNNTRISKNCV